MLVFCFFLTSFRCAKSTDFLQSKEEAEQNRSDKEFVLLLNKKFTNTTVYINFSVMHFGLN